MSNRIDKVNELLSQQLAEYFNREVEFPDNALVTIIKIETSKDLSRAVVWLSVLPTSQRGSALLTLKNSAKDLNHFLKKALFIRRIPHFEFRIDDTEEKAAIVEDIINNINK